MRIKSHDLATGQIIMHEKAEWDIAWHLLSALMAAFARPASIGMAAL